MRPQSAFYRNVLRCQRRAFRPMLGPPHRLALRPRRRPTPLHRAPRPDRRRSARVIQRSASSLSAPIGWKAGSPPWTAVTRSPARNRCTRPFSDIRNRRPSGRCWPKPDQLLRSAHRQQADERSSEWSMGS